MILRFHLNITFTSNFQALDVPTQLRARYSIVNLLSLSLSPKNLRQFYHLITINGVAAAVWRRPPQQASVLGRESPHALIPGVVPQRPTFSVHACVRAVRTAAHV